jgi:putative membrane protein
MMLSNGIRGAIAGAAGGIVGGAVKLACEALVPPRPPDREPPPGVLVADVVRATDGRELSKDEKQRAAMTVHWIFSLLSGALHGVAVEANASLARSEGVPFGLAIWLGFHEVALPLLHATPPLPELPLSEQINECITHCAYGFSVERTRRSLRPLLNPF